MAKINHVAINVTDLSWYIDFFSNAFGMRLVDEEVENTQLKQVWIEGGIQLIRHPEIRHAHPSRLAHIAIEVDNLADAIAKVKSLGGTTMAKGNNWLQIPGGICLELLDSEGR